MNNLELQVLKIWGENKAPPGKEKEYAAKKDAFLLRVQQVIDAPIEERFDQLYCGLKVSYAEIPVILTYIEDNMMPKKEEFAEYICKYMPSFGQRTTSCLESSHGRLKRALLNRSGHPNDIVKDIY